MTNLYRSNAVLFVLVALVGCGPGGEETPENPSANSDASLNATTAANQTSVDTNNAMTPPGEEYRGGGWLQHEGVEQGLWIEQEQAVLPDDCSGELAAVPPTVSLAYTTWNADDVRESGENSAPGGLDDRGFTARPDLAEPPTPIYNVGVVGLISQTTEHMPHTRKLELRDQGLDEIIYLDVCGTMKERGACHIPTDAFSFSGCHGGGFMYSVDTIQREADGTFVLEFNRGTECDLENRRTGNHPRDLPIGTQIVRISPGTDLEDGEVLDLTAAMVDWKSSIKTRHSCSDLAGPEPLCSCSWDQVPVAAELERGWLLKQGNKLYLELKSGVRAEDDYVWGGFEIVDADAR